MEEISPGRIRPDSLNLGDVNLVEIRSDNINWGEVKVEDVNSYIVNLSLRDVAINIRYAIPEVISELRVLPYNLTESRSKVW